MPAVEPQPAAALAAIGFLLFSVPTLWLPRWIWAATILAAVIAGYAAAVLHGPAMIWLLALAVTASQFPRAQGWTRIGLLALTASLGLLLGLHLLPGFSNPILLRDVVLADNARPYSQYVNFDKTLAGALFLGCSGWKPIESFGQCGTALRRILPIMIATVSATMIASLALGFVRFDPRWAAVFPVWAVVNLLTTCVSEEAFFRGLLQSETNAGLARRLNSQRASFIAIAISAVLFGLAHVAGGWQYVLAATIAGGGYALVYQLTGRLEMAILTHFLVNAVHFLLFTYPALL